MATQLFCIAGRTTSLPAHAHFIGSYAECEEELKNTNPELGMGIYEYLDWLQMTEE